MSARDRRLPKDLWERHKDKIIELYRDRNLKVSEVQEEMAKIGFDASERMYYPKFKAWGILKHEKADEKDQLCDTLLELHRKGQKLPYLSASRLNKLQRRYKERLSKGQAAEELGNLLQMLQKQSFQPEMGARIQTGSHEQNAAFYDSDDSDESLADILRSLPSSFSESSSGRQVHSSSASKSKENSEKLYDWTMVSSVPRTNLSSSKANTELEGLLLMTRDHYEASLEQYLQMETDANKMLGEVSSSAVPSLETNKVFWTKVKSAVYFLKASSGVSEGLSSKLLGQASQMVPDLCCQNPFSLLKDIFATLSPVNMRINLAYRATLLGLFTYNFPPSYPFFSICSSLAESEMLSEEVSVPALQLLIDLSNQWLSAGHIELFELRRTLIRLLRRQGNLTDAAQRSVELIETSENQSGKSHIQTRLAMTELVYILNDQKRYRESLILAERVVRRGEQAQGDGSPDERTVYAMEDAAEICDRLGRVEDSISWLRRALRRALKVWKNKEATIHINDKLEILYGRVGRALPRFPMKGVSDA